MDRLRPRSSALVLCLLVAPVLLVVACGGGSKATGVSDYGKVATATAPARMPDVVFTTGGGAVGGPGRRYTVQEGDSPSSIADRFGITADELMAANGLTSSSILHVGDVLTIPGSADTGTPGPSGTTPSPTPRNGRTPTPTSEAAPPGGRTPGADQQVYTVQSGDNASTIAAQFGITVEQLAAMNGTTVDGLRSLQVGDTLIVPAGAPQPAATEPPPTEAPPLPTDTPPVEAPLPTDTPPVPAQ